jgi:hypothetical protein
MADPRAHTCSDCGIQGFAAPDKLPPTEFPVEILSAIHQWARFFEHLNHDAYAESHPEPAPTALDFVHYLSENQRLHDHRPGRSEPAGRPGRLRTTDLRALRVSLPRAV